MRFGSLYLLAGAGSCLYLGGLFFGNRLGERLTRRIGEESVGIRWMALAVTLLQAVAALGVLTLSERASTEYGIIGWCLAIGCAAGLTVPVAFSASGGDHARSAAVFARSALLSVSPPLSQRVE